MGHSDLNNKDAFDVKVESVNVHPEFSMKPYPVNDIAILKLSTKLEIDDKVTPICLPEGNTNNQNVRIFLRDFKLLQPRNRTNILLQCKIILTKNLRNMLTNACYVQTPIYKRGTVAGWGATETRPSSDVLMELDLDIIPEETCEREFKKVVHNFNLTSTRICARAELHRDGCRGDSGGPLMHVTEAATYDVIGITSFGNKNCDSSSPGVYTRVSSYLDWIGNTVEDTLLQSNPELNSIGS